VSEPAETGPATVTLPPWLRERLRSPQDAAAGLFLIGLALFALWQTSDLTAGTFRAFGPGMMPRLLSIISGLTGVIILGNALVTEGPGLERWTLRGPLFLLGGAVAFGLTIRPLGLSVAAPLALVICAYASPETRLKETLVFGLLMTIFCIGLFKFLLGLPIPLAPWLIGY
jgi:putative tricarboxylic transport membrane protein